MFKGIDVSTFQKVIDWDKVKPQIDYAIIRVGFGNDIVKQDDAYFKRNADECTRLGIPFGVYLYSYADTEAKAKSEAAHVLRLLKGYKLTYPVYYDLEDAKTTGKCSNAQILQFAKLFCAAVEAAGYQTGIYANAHWLRTKLTDAWYATKSVWVALYNKTCTYKGKYDMWQYTSSGKMDGIKGRVDMNYCYTEYAKPVESKPSTAPANTPNTQSIVLAWQKAAIADGYKFPKYGADGKWGTECAGVAKKAQCYKRAIGYYNRNLTKIVQKAVGVKDDGLFGNATKKAVIAYQQQNKLTADGIVGINTWKKILGV